MFELSILYPGCALVSIWLVCLLAVGDFVSGLCPFPMFIGEVLTVCRSLWWPWLLVFLFACGALPFWK